MKRPLLWPLLGLISGILSVAVLRLSPKSIFIFLLLSLLFLILGAQKKQKLVLMIASGFLFAALGYWSTMQKLESVDQHSNLRSFISNEKIFLRGKIAERCVQDQEGGALVVDAWQVTRLEKSLPAHGKIGLRVAGENACDFSVGDVVQTYAVLKAPGRYFNEHSFDYPFYLKLQGITATAFVESKDFVVKMGEESSSFSHGLEALRAKSLQALGQLSDKNRSQILAALLLGSQELSLQTQELFRKTGTTHLLVVSGLHLAMVMGLFYLFFRLLFSCFPSLLLRISVKRLSYWTAIFPVLFYASLVGYTPSVLRGSLAILVLGGLLLWRRALEGLSLVFLIALFLLFFSPLLLFNLSFELSFLSILSILLFVPFLEKGFFGCFPSLQKKKLVKHFIQIVLVSLAVQGGLFPLLVLRFHQMSLVSIPANLFLVSYFSFVIMPLGMLGLLFSWFYPLGGVLLFKMAAALLKPALLLLQALSSLAWSAPYVPGMNWVQILAYLSILVCLLLPLSRHQKLTSLFLLLLLNISFWIYPGYAEKKNTDLNLTFLDVGQGDSLLVEFPFGEKMLIDAGGIAGSSFDIGEKVLLPELLGRGVSHLDYLVLTHPHPDHFGGMRALLKAFHPREFWWNGEEVASHDFQALLAQLRAQGIPFFKKNSASPELNIQGVKLRFLYPKPDVFFPQKPDAATLNNHSLVISLEDRGLKILLAGDMQEEAEKDLLAQAPFENFFILKVPHHGSSTSSTEDFVEKIHPAIALIGVGRNNHFGFPKPEVLARYQKIGAQVLRTDQNGEIHLRWNGEKLEGSDFMNQSYSWKPIPNPVVSNQKEICRESSC